MRQLSAVPEAAGVLEVEVQLKAPKETGNLMVLKEVESLMVLKEVESLTAVVDDFLSYLRFPLCTVYCLADCRENKKYMPKLLYKLTNTCLTLKQT